MPATCKTCPFWHCTGGTLPRGECRARPAVEWTFRRGDEWCGEHPLRQRDRLAAMVIQGYAARYGGTIQDGPVAARFAYAWADAMLAAGAAEDK